MSNVESEVIPPTSDSSDDDSNHTSDVSVPNSRKRRRQSDNTNQDDLCNMNNVCVIYKDLSIANRQLSKSLKQYITLSESYDDLYTSYSQQCNNNANLHFAYMFVICMLIGLFSVSNYYELRLQNIDFGCNSYISYFNSCRQI